MNRDTETLNRRAHQIMSREPITVSPNASLKEAAGLMLETPDLPVCLCWRTAPWWA